MIWAFVLRYHRALIGVALIVGLFITARAYVNGQVEQARLEDAAAVAKVDAIADDVAGQVAASEAASVQEGNDDARKAASAGTDPLGDALRQLHKGKTGNR